MRSSQEYKNLSSPRGRKTNEEKINSQFAILQSLVLLCDALTGGSALSACGSGSQSRGSSVPNATPALSHPLPPPLSTHTYNTHTNTQAQFPYKGVLRGTPGHCSVFLLYSMIFRGYSHSQTMLRAFFFRFKKCRLNILNE